ncbi:uncharacterized protein F4817DRAFT_313058 [Daldinia loculata]|uniref:uncharacterized protein n=1 Tax=Daldinia loculata TaxID=103429 RepID=UPI0020C2C4CE|nr:uncharacterized protein F4817DRAFT_313058 [Daldinia loculata]KAI1650199.1 hypothetical protein F4817DRAFT_313058 [Daldinia loculata]
MRCSTFAASAIASFAFLQCIVAPVPLMAIGISAATAEAITSGLTAGTIGAATTVGLTCGTGKCNRRSRAAFIYASKIAQEIAEQLNIPDGDAQGIPPPPTAPEGVPQFNIDACYYDALSANVTMNGPIGDNHIRVEGLPQTCMVLSTILSGKVDGPQPIPCGNACIEYTGMSVDEYESIRHILNTQVLKNGET